MTPLGSWNLPTLKDETGAALLPDDMNVVVYQDGAPLDINGLPLRLPWLIVWDKSNAGRSRLDAYDAGQPGLAFNVAIKAIRGGQVYKLAFRCDLPTGIMEAVPPPTHPCVDPTPFPNMELTADPFDFPRPNSGGPSLLPVEAGDDDGQVYGTVPHEFFALPGARPQKGDIRLIRGDAFTFMTQKSPWEINPALTLDWLVSIGQNTNFDGKMVYTPLVPLYPMDWQIAFMKEYRVNNTHLLIQGSFVDQSIVDATVTLARSMGVWAVVFDTNAQRLVDRINRGMVDFPVLGLEVNNELDPQGILDAITNVAPLAKAKGLPFGLHFTSTGGPDKEHSYAFPVPPMDYIPWWTMIQRMGVTHLLYEAWMTYGGDMDSAGRMGSFMFYARVVLCQASRLNPDLPPVLLCAAEIMSAPPFMGKVDAFFSHRRAAEMLGCPNTGYDDMPGVCGSLNGGMFDIETGKVL
jgi:hypothetical protein